MPAGADKVISYLRELAAEKGNGLAIAFSGGLDSLVLLQLCVHLELDIIAIHAVGPQFALAHSRAAAAWLQKKNIPHKIAEHHALMIPEVRETHPRRCYYCKKALIDTLRQAALGRALCDGTHAGDLEGYRPGLDALREQQVISPFLETGLAKPQIRQVAEAYNFDLPEYHGQNCLLTRFEYGHSVREEYLRRIESAEAALAPLLAQPFRLRYFKSGPELHIEARAPMPEDLQEALEAALATCGLSGTPIRVLSRLSGFFDLSLPQPLL